MKRTLAAFLPALLLAACGPKQDAGKPSAVAPEAAHASSVGSPSTTTAPPAEAIAGRSAPQDAVHAGVPQSDPHAGLERQAINAGTGRRGRVIETMNAAGYTYIQVDEKGFPVWLAVLETPVKKGDVVEFPDAQPMTNFRSKTLNRTFDSILFVPGIRVDRK